MPARNAERTLADALASIRAQTVAVAEIVVVDDGSSDATAAIARAAGATVVEGPRMGPGAARNAGIRAAAQPWIAFLDADDRWDPEKTARQLAALNAVPEVGFSATDVRAARDGKPVRASWFAAEPAYRRVARGALPGGAVLAARGGLLEALGRNNFLVTSSVMVRRELVAAGVFFDETLLQTPDCFVPEDWEWYLRVLGQTDAVIVEAPLVEYRLSAASLSADGPRLSCGAIELARLVREGGGRYPPAAVDAFAAAQAQRLATAGTIFARALDFTRARDAFGGSLRASFSPKTALLLATATALDNPAGRRLAGAVRSLWRARA